MFLLLRLDDECLFYPSTKAVSFVHVSGFCRSGSIRCAHQARGAQENLRHYRCRPSGGNPKIAAFEDQKKQRLAEITSMIQNELKAQNEFNAGHYDEAYRIANAHAIAAAAYETKMGNKPGGLAAAALGELSWYARVVLISASRLRATRSGPLRLARETMRQERSQLPLCLPRRSLHLTHHAEATFSLPHILYLLNMSSIIFSATGFCDAKNK